VKGLLDAPLKLARHIVTIPQGYAMQGGGAKADWLGSWETHLIKFRQGQGPPAAGSVKMELSGSSKTQLTWESPAIAEYRLLGKDSKGAKDAKKAQGQKTSCQDSRPPPVFGTVG
jgi:hypothetical protein